MKLLSIGLSDSDRQEQAGGINSIKTAIEKALILLAEDGFIVKIEEVSKGNYIFLECHIEEGELSFKNYERIKEILRNYIADALTDVILTSREDGIIQKIVKQNYIYFSPEEHKILAANTKKALNGNSHKNNDFDTEYRRWFIRRVVLEYLDIHHELTLDGFINFRLKEYRKKLENIIEAVADDFMMEEEYKEFIRVLRYFVDIQPPRTEEVHVVTSGNGTFKILDKSGNLINTQYLGNIVTQSCVNQEIEIMSPADPVQCKPIKFKQTEFRPNDIINYDDALISVLITIAPNHIMFHSNNFSTDKETIETIKSVFTDRVLICRSCEICRIEKFESERH